LSRGTYSVSGSSAAQLYTDIIITDPCTPSLESWRDPLRPASEFGLGPVGAPYWATSLGDGLYDTLRYDVGGPGHPGGLGPHVNAETWLKDGPKGKNESLSDKHIDVK